MLRSPSYCSPVWWKMAKKDLYIKDFSHANSPQGPLLYTQSPRQDVCSPATPNRFSPDRWGSVHWCVPCSPNVSPIGSPGGAMGVQTVQLPVYLQSPGDSGLHGLSTSPSSFDGSPNSTGSNRSFWTRRMAGGDVPPAYSFRDRAYIRRPAHLRSDRRLSRTFALGRLSHETHHALYSPLTDNSSQELVSVSWKTSDSMSDINLSSSREQSSSPEQSSPLSVCPSGPGDL
jgi:hypothetical protein